MDGLGWVDNNGNASGKTPCNEIEFSLATNSANSVLKRVGDNISKGLEQIGLSVQYEKIDFGDLVSQLTQTYDWDPFS